MTQKPERENVSIISSIYHHTTKSENVHPRPVEWLTTIHWLVNTETLYDLLNLTYTDLVSVVNLFIHLETLNLTPKYLISKQSATFTQKHLVNLTSADLVSFTQLVTCLLSHKTLIWSIIKLHGPDFIETVGDLLTQFHWSSCWPTDLIPLKQLVTCCTWGPPYTITTVGYFLPASSPWGWKNKPWWVNPDWLWYWNSSGAL